MAKEPKFKQMSQPERFEVSKLIEMHCVRHPTIPDRCEYAPGWSDARIAAIAIPNYTGDAIKAVQSQRRLLGFGTIVAPPSEASVGLKGRITALEAEHKELAKRHIDLLAGVTAKLLTFYERLEQNEKLLIELKNKIPFGNY